VSDLIASCNDREPEKVGSIAEGQWNDLRLVPVMFVKTAPGNMHGMSEASIFSLVSLRQARQCEEVEWMPAKQKN
jgi:hypothetical protein